jgi:F-type H+-transporting ATPase subunit delta
MSAIAKRYAKAAVESANEAGGTAAMDSLLEGLRAFLASVTESAALRELLYNPALRQRRPAVLEAILSRLDLHETVAKVIALLAERDRLDLLEDVVAEAEGLVDERLGRLRAHVTSATALSEAHRQRLGRALERRFGRPIVVSLRTDPSILGGLVCNVGDVTLDSSVRRQLELLRERLLTTDL